MRLLIVDNEHADDTPQLLTAWARDRGLDVTRVEGHDWSAGPVVLDHAGFDAIVLTGSVESVTRALPWAEAEAAFLRRADAAGVPILGICFGGQLLAHAFGGTVRRMPTKEIGWVEVDSTDPDVPAGPWFAWHEDEFMPPPGAEVLARTDICVQAFRLGPHLGVQFHPEVSGPLARRWLDLGGHQYEELTGHDREELVAESFEREPAARKLAFELFDGWLRRAGQRVGN